ncbi:hypothetical protein GS506_03400 [Rhodococcus hoagii]|nr:hypothetical protein [Prescottella equi]
MQKSSQQSGPTGRSGGGSYRGAGGRSRHAGRRGDSGKSYAFGPNTSVTTGRTPTR